MLGRATTNASSNFIHIPPSNMGYSLRYSLTLKKESLMSFQTLRTELKKLANQEAKIRACYEYPYRYYDGQHCTHDRSAYYATKPREEAPCNCTTQ